MAHSLESQEVETDFGEILGIGTLKDKIKKDVETKTSLKKVENKDLLIKEKQTIPKVSKANKKTKKNSKLIEIQKESTKSINPSKLSDRNISTTNNEELLIRKHENITQKLPWIQRLDLTNEKSIDIENIEDDFGRENAFVQQALLCVDVAKERIKKLELSFTRPDDYFAEMIKSDEHMLKIRKTLIKKRTEIDSLEKKKEKKNLKKFSKKMQKESLLRKIEEKKTNLKAISDIKKSRKNSLFNTAEDFDIEIEKEFKPKPQKKNVPNLKRIRKNDRYGFGGKKRLLKKNDSTSSWNDTDFSVKKNKIPFSGVKSKHSSNKTKKKTRIGKSRRKQLKK